MPNRHKDANQKVAAQVAKVTKTKKPKGEDLLGPALKTRYAEAKKATRNQSTRGDAS